MSKRREVNDAISALDEAALAHVDAAGRLAYCAEQLGKQLNAAHPAVSKKIDVTPDGWLTIWIGATGRYRVRMTTDGENSWITPDVDPDERTELTDAIASILKHAGVTG